MAQAFVDIPPRDYNLGDWETVAEFEGPKAREEALLFAKLRYGADDEGRVNIVSVYEDMDDDGEANLEEVLKNQMKPNQLLD